jgi:hypothetical protein
MSRFRLSYDFANRGYLKSVGPMIKARWQLTPEAEASRLHVPPPVKGFMVVDTGFVGIGIDSDVAQELDLQPFGTTKVQGIETDITRTTYSALLLMMLGNVDGEDLAIGGTIEAVCIPKFRSAYDSYGLVTPEGAPLSVIGVLGRTFLQFTKFGYDGLNGCWDMEIDVNAMSAFASTRENVAGLRNH